MLFRIQSGGLWSRTPAPPAVGPALYKTDFTIRDQPHDTFVHMKVQKQVSIKRFLKRNLADVGMNQ